MNTFLGIIFLSSPAKIDLKIIILLKLYEYFYTRAALKRDESHLLFFMQCDDKFRQNQQFAFVKDFFQNFFLAYQAAIYNKYEPK